MVSWIASGSLRAKMAVLWAVASVLPLGLVGVLDWRQARERLQASLQEVLEARSDQVVREVDSFHRAHQPEAARMARFQAVRAYCGAAVSGTAPATGLEAQVHDILAAYPASDGQVRGAALLDRNGHVMLATEMPLAGLDLSRQPHVRAALRGAAVVSEVHLAIPELTEKPRIAYLAPVLAPDGQFACVAALWVRAAALAQVLRSSNALEGPGSFAVLFDSQGIRIAHSAGDDLLFRPAGRLEPAVVEVLVAQARFGAGTRALLDDVRPAPGQFERARAATPDAAMFLSESPSPSSASSGTDTPRRPGSASAVVEARGGDYGVARRAASVPWTVFYFAPRAPLDAQLAALRLDKLAQAAALLLLAYGAGLLFVRGIVRSVRNLSAVTTAIAGGHLEARGREHSADELGRLGLSFNTMAARLQAQMVDLQRSRDMLDTRVQVRTGELHRATHKLEAQAAERHLAEEAMHEGQQLLQAIIDHSSTVILVKDLKGRYLLVNRRLRELRGLDEEGLLGKTDHEIYPPEVADLMRASDQRAAVAAYALVEEERVPHEDGVRDYLTVKCPLHDRTGRVYGICGISTDVTALKHAAGQLQVQADRLGLLEQIAGAIGEQKDLPSLCQAALGHLEEHMPLDFSGMCRWDADGHVLVMGRMSMRSTVVAAELALSESAHLLVDSSVLWRGVHGELVHEPDISELAFPFPQRLARAGLRALVVVPLYAGSQVLGVLLAARRPAHAFSGNDCDFLCQFGALLALAVQQAQIREALQQAQEDLRQVRLHDAQPESL